MLGLEGRCARAEVRIPRGPGSSCPVGLRGWCWWVGQNLERGVWVSAGQGPWTGRAHARREWPLFIHPAEMTFQMHIISSMQMRGLFNMNDRPLNSYYYMAHCHNYVVHLVSLCPAPSLLPLKGREGKDTSAGTPFLSFSLFQTCCQSYNFAVFCECWKGTTFPSLGEITARFFLLSPGRAYTREACLCLLGPRSSQISEQLVWDSELEAALCPSRARIGGKGELSGQWAPAVFPHPQLRSRPEWGKLLL